MPQYGFDIQFDLGKFGEQRLLEFRHPKYTLTKSTIAQEQCGYDFVFLNRETSETWTIELKTDFKAHASQNAFIETIAVDNASKHNPGWVFTSTAQVLLYFIPQSGQLFVVDLKKLRDSMPEFAKRYQSVFTRTQHGNSYYKTHGLLVPLSELAKLSNGVLTLPVKLPPAYNRISSDRNAAALPSKKPKKKALTRL